MCREKQVTANFSSTPWLGVDLLTTDTPGLGVSALPSPLVDGGHYKLVLNISIQLSAPYSATSFTPLTPKYICQCFKNTKFRCLLHQRLDQAVKEKEIAQPWSRQVNVWNEMIVNDATQCHILENFEPLLVKKGIDHKESLILSSLPKPIL